MGHGLTGHTMIANRLLHGRDSFLRKWRAGEQVAGHLCPDERVIAPMKALALLTNVVKSNCRPDRRQIPTFSCLKRFRQSYHAYNVVKVVGGVRAPFLLHSCAGAFEQPLTKFYHVFIRYFLRLSKFLVA